MVIVIRLPSAAKSNSNILPSAARCRLRFLTLLSSFPGDLKNRQQAWMNAAAAGVDLEVMGSPGVSASGNIRWASRFSIVLRLTYFSSSTSVASPLPMITPCRPLLSATD